MTQHRANSVNIELPRSQGSRRAIAAATTASTVDEAPREQARESVSLWRRLFRQATAQRQNAADLHDPALRFLVEWVVAQGGRVDIEAPDVVRGALRDGTAFAYTSSPQRAAVATDLELVAPAFPALEHVLDSAIRQSAGLALDVPAGPVNPVLVARAAVFPGRFELSRTNMSTTRLEIQCVGKLRGGVVVAQTRRYAHEFIWRLSVSSLRGQRDELPRTTIDADTGEQLTVIDSDLLGRARTAEEFDSAHAPTVEHAQRARVLVDAAAQAAGRLARMQSLPAYQLRQDELENAYRHMLLETPEQAKTLLVNRERDLERLAETFAVDVRTELLNVVTLITPVAHVRMDFAGGGQLTLAVDTCRAAIMPPMCAGCGREWTSGARCASNHITCSTCQKKCEHCGVRHCVRCTSAPPQPCDTCGGLACARCAARSVRRRRCKRVAATEEEYSRLVHSSAGAEVSVQSSVSTEQSTRALMRGNLNASEQADMTDATWNELLLWLLESLGMQPCVSAPAAIFPSYVMCVVSKPQSLPRDMHTLVVGDRVYVSSLREWASPHIVEDVCAHLSQVAQRTSVRYALLFTSAVVHTGPLGPSDTHPRVILFDWNAIDGLVQAHVDAHRAVRSITEETMEQRAEAAARVRAVLILALRASHDTLAHAATPAARQARLPQRSDAIERLTESLATARQALTALETLIEEWEEVFAATPNRSGAQEIVTDVASLGALADRSVHLTQVLIQACTQLANEDVGVVGPERDWEDAVTRQISKLSMALALRCEALNPSAWRTFELVRDHAAAAAGVAALAESARAGIRASQLQQDPRGAASRQPADAPG